MKDSSEKREGDEEEEEEAGIWKGKEAPRGR